MRWSAGTPAQATTAQKLLHAAAVSGVSSIVRHALATKDSDAAQSKVSSCREYGTIIDEVADYLNAADPMHEAVATCAESFSGQLAITGAVAEVMYVVSENPPMDLPMRRWSVLPANSA